MQVSKLQNRHEVKNHVRVGSMLTEKKEGDAKEAILKATEFESK